LRGLRSPPDESSGRSVTKRATRAHPDTAPRLTTLEDGANRPAVGLPEKALDVGLETIRRKLAAHDARTHDGPAERRAAVAAVLRPGSAGLELLLIRRAEREGDPWSGHMALPGGHADASDRDLLATALRETREEVGIDLARHELLGALDEHAANAQGRFTGLVIAPFVFALRDDPVISPNYEVAEVLWGPLAAMARGEIDAVLELQRAGKTMRFPGYEVGGQVVWGLTHRVLQNLFGVLGS
jgi:8-oxo-dGTP pyrophosphatase MutT (NUDIX family)